MTNEVTICIATYGDDSWQKIAQERAIPSAEAQTVSADIICNHSLGSLSQSRNEAAERVKTEFIIFLDADDELDPGYVQNMVTGSTDLRQPATLGVVNGVEDDFPVVIERKPLLRANFMVIGTMCRKDMFDKVNGFIDLPVLEDWDLWLRMVLFENASIQAIPEAIYRVHVNPDSRNQNSYVHGQIYRWIQHRYLPIAREKGMMWI